MNHIHHNLLKLTENHLGAGSIIIVANGAIILLSFLLINVIGNNFLFILILISGFLLASIPALIQKWQSNHDPIEVEENKSIFALSIFTKTKKD